jgi:hypothetical protein
VALKGENIGENESGSAALQLGARKRNGGVSAAMAAWRGGEMAASAASALNGVSKKMASAARINIAMYQYENVWHRENIRYLMRNGENNIKSA